MISENLPLILIIIAIAAALILVLILIRRRNISISGMDGMEGHDFEYYCAGLLENAGFEEVEVTKGSGDFGVDILAMKDGISYAFQCKCYDKPIGVKAIQEIYAGRDYYDRMVGVVMTNQSFTEPARAMASKLNIIMWDRNILESM